MFENTKAKEPCGSVDSVINQFSKAAVNSDDSLITFEDCHLKLDNENDSKCIVEKLNSNSATIFNLKGNTLGVKAAEHLGEALATHPELKRAQWSDLFTGRLKTEIPDALRFLGNGIIKSGAQLVELDLSDNAFGPNGMNGLTELLQSYSCYRLKELKLNNNGLGVTGGRMLAESLLKCYKNCLANKNPPFALRVFISGRGRLEDEGSIALAEVFKLMGSLEVISMPQNGITHRGITALSEALSKNTSLKSINFNDNTVTEIGARALGKALTKLQNLETLNIGDCLLRNKGAKIIANSLKNSHLKLVEVNMSFNEIRPDGGIIVAEAMSNKQLLTNLYLDGNQFGCEGIEMIRNVMNSQKMADNLGGFSDDEGSDSQEETSDSDTESDVDSNEESTVYIPQTTATLSTPQNTSISAGEFFLFPSPKKLGQLSDTGCSWLVDHFNGDFSSINECVKVVVKTSLVIPRDDSIICKNVLNAIDSLFRRVVDFHSGEDIGIELVNTILVHLGLLKSEERVSKPSKLDGPVFVLTHIVGQDYFPMSAAVMLNGFMQFCSHMESVNKEEKLALMNKLNSVVKPNNLNGNSHRY